MKVKNARNLQIYDILSRITQYWYKICKNIYKNTYILLFLFSVS
ncbi:hypothetical protein HMPREF3226_02721 [Prevotella corporis]|uniref:Uncharacterized protein n=1 Tax=Prevotella corporis TaxID=28128 RepID=A0A133PTR6_9BACT|nr:hypothetical protein HMPREF3226_02721 [Prevotella corporis]